MISSESPTPEELREELRKNREALDALTEFLAWVATAMAPGKPEIVERAARAVGIELEPSESAREQILSMIRLARQSAPPSQTLSLSSEVVASLTTIAERWRATRTEGLGGISWRDVAQLAILELLEREEKIK